METKCTNRVQSLSVWDNWHYNLLSEEFQLTSVERLPEQAEPASLAHVRDRTITILQIAILSSDTILAIRHVRCLPLRGLYRAPVYSSLVFVGQHMSLALVILRKCITLA